MKIAHVVADLLTSLSTATSVQSGLDLALRRLLRLSGADAGALEFRSSSRRADRGGRRGSARSLRRARGDPAQRGVPGGVPGWRRDGSPPAPRGGIVARGASPSGRDGPPHRAGPDPTAGGPARADRIRPPPRPPRGAPGIRPRAGGGDRARVAAAAAHAAHDRPQRDHPAARLQRLARRRAEPVCRWPGPPGPLRRAGRGPARPRARRVRGARRAGTRGAARGPPGRPHGAGQARCWPSSSPAPSRSGWTTSAPPRCRRSAAASSPSAGTAPHSWFRS